MGPAVLGRHIPALERLAGCAALCSTGHGHPLATATVPQVLGPTISNQTWSPRKTCHRRRDSTAYPANGRGQSPLARTENPRRIEDARDRDIGAHRLADSPNDS